MDQKTKVYLSVATQYAVTTENIQQEDQAAVRANDIVNDAMQENPSTEAGIAVKEKAENIIAVHATNSVESPYMEKPTFDYNKLRQETAIPACVEILKKFGEHADSVFITKDDSEERSKIIDDSYNTLANSILEIFDKNNVALKDVKYIFNNLSSLVTSFLSAIEGKVDNQKDEILARYIGVRNPGNDKEFNVNHATYKSLVEARDRVFNETGGKLEDYHHVMKE